MTKRGIAGSKSAGPRTMRISASSGCCLAREMIENARAQGLGVLPAAQHLDQRDQRAIDDGGPARLRGEFGRIAAGFLLELAPHAEIEIDLAVDDIVGVGRAAGKIDLAGIEGVRAHDAEQKGAVGG